MTNLSKQDRDEFERLYLRLLHQQSNAFFCVVVNTVMYQSEIAKQMKERFPAGEVQIVDFKFAENAFLFSPSTLIPQVEESTKILFLANFQLAQGDLTDVEFFQTLNLSRDILAELPYVIVFMMPMYYRVMVARNAPDFNSFFQYRADFISGEDLKPPEHDFKTINFGYSQANKELLEYYREKYSHLKNYESKDAFEVLVKILRLNVEVQILDLVERNRFFELFEKLFIKYQKDISDLIFDIAWIYFDNGHYDRSLELHLDAIEKWKNVLGEESERIIDAYTGIAWIYEDQGHYEKALEQCKKVIDVCENKFGKEYIETAYAYINVTSVYCKRGDYNEALKWNFMALKVIEELFEEDHPERAAAYNRMGYIYYYKGEYDETLNWYDKALKIDRNVLGENHPSVSVTYSNIALANFRKGDYTAAVRGLHEALSITEKKLGKRHRNTATIYENLAEVYYEQENYDEALKYYRKAFEIYKNTFGLEYSETLSIAGKIASITQQQ